jgi:hypothetical protein
MTFMQLKTMKIILIISNRAHSVYLKSQLYPLIYSDIQKKLISLHKCNYSNWSMYNSIFFNEKNKEQINRIIFAKKYYKEGVHLNRLMK